MPKRRIVYVITGLNTGGAEVMLYRLLANIDREMFECSVISLIAKGDIGKQIEQVLGLSVYSLNTLKGPGAIKSFIELGLLLKKLKPDLVHSHMVHANILTRLVRIFFRFPLLVCTIHNIEERGSARSAKWRLLAYRLTDRFCDLTTQVSKAGLEKYLKINAISAAKAMHIPNGIELSSFSVSEQDITLLKESMKIKRKYVFLAVGSLTTQKDYPNMLRAFKRVNEQNADTVLLIAGDGPLLHDLKTLAKELSLVDVVSFLGLRRDVATLMNLATALLVSSAWEGLPVVLLEAAASKLPIIATDVGGNGEVVIDHLNGYLVPADDSEAFASAINRYLALSEDEKLNMGLEGYKHVKANYSIEEVTQQWQGVYCSLMHNLT